jgi:hypothetical protein
MKTFETLLASVTALVCVLLLIRLAVGHARRQRIDAMARRATQGLRAAGTRSLHAVKGLGRSRAQRQDAARAAEAAIERAKRGAWDGNVYRPERFGKTDTKAQRKPH